MFLRTLFFARQIFVLLILAFANIYSSYCFAEPNMENLANSIIQGYRGGIYASMKNSFSTFQQRFENTRISPSVDIKIPFIAALAKFDRSSETNGFCLGSEKASECVIFSLSECEKEIDKLTVVSNCKGEVYGKEGISYPIKLAKDILSDESANFSGADGSTEFVLKQSSEFMIKHGVLLSSENGRPEALINEDGMLINSEVGYSGYDITQHLSNSDECSVIALEAVSDNEIIRALNTICGDSTDLEILQVSRKENEKMFAQYSSERIPSFLESTWHRLFD